MARLSDTYFDEPAEQLHYIIHLPHPRVSPLELRSGGHAVVDNVFTLPRWGAVHVVAYNGSIEVPHIVSTSRAMMHFVKHLRQHIGAQSVAGVSGTLLTTLDTWELDRIRRQNVYHHGTLAIGTLEVLSNMASDMSDAHITKECAAAAHLAVKALARVPLAWSAAEALSAAREASTMAHTALHDPDITPHLHFPEDEMYAIFVPYIIPAGVALLRSVRRRVSTK